MERLDGTGLTVITTIIVVVGAQGGDLKSLHKILATQVCPRVETSAASYYSTSYYNRTILL